MDGLGVDGLDGPDDGAGAVGGAVAVCAEAVKVNAAQKSAAASETTRRGCFMMHAGLSQRAEVGDPQISEIFADYSEVRLRGSTTPVSLQLSARVVTYPIVGIRVTVSNLIFKAIMI